MNKYDQLPTNLSSLDKDFEKKLNGSVCRESFSTELSYEFSSDNSENDMTEAPGDQWMGWMGVKVKDVNETWKAEYSNDSFRKENAIERATDLNNDEKQSKVIQKTVAITKPKKIGRSSNICNIS